MTRWTVTIRATMTRIVWATTMHWTAGLFVMSLRWEVELRYKKKASSWTATIVTLRGGDNDAPNCLCRLIRRYRCLGLFAAVSWTIEKGIVLNRYDSRWRQRYPELFVSIDKATAMPWTVYNGSTTVIWTTVWLGTFESTWQRLCWVSSWNFLRRVAAAHMLLLFDSSDDCA